MIEVCCTCAIQKINENTYFRRHGKLLHLSLCFIYLCWFAVTAGVTISKFPCFLIPDTSRKGKYRRKTCLIDTLACLSQVAIGQQPCGAAAVRCCKGAVLQMCGAAAVRCSNGAVVQRYGAVTVPYSKGAVQ